MPKILLVDDSKLQLKCIKQMLAAAGHEVIATSSGRTAVRHLASEPFDLVVSDLYMPEPDGFEIMQAVRALPRPIPLIVMSANSLACDVFRDARAFGAAAVLNKPFQAEKLVATVDAVLAPSVATGAG
jgi:CheY-like chemotaxis protein